MTNDAGPPVVTDVIRPYVIVDLDGTLANIDHRLHHIQGEDKDWPAFFQACVDDSPIWSNIHLVNALSDNGNVIIIITGRSDEVRKETHEWLDRHQVKFHTLHMRKQGDHRPDHVLKQEIAALAGLGPFDVLGVLEDRMRVAQMWRERGHHVWHCPQESDGNF